MDLKEFTKIAFSFYSQTEEVSNSELETDFEEYWNDKDTQDLIKNLKQPSDKNEEVINFLDENQKEFQSWMKDAKTAHERDTHFRFVQAVSYLKQMWKAENK